MTGDEKRGDPENPYTEPGESKAGRGGIISPGGQQPKPSEDPRKDSGLHDEHPDQSPPVPEPPAPEQQSAA